MGFLSKHWRGQEKFVIAFWRNGVGVNILFNVLSLLLAFVFLGEQSAPLMENPVLLFAGMIIGTLFAATVTVWQVTGMWRTAGAYIDVDYVFWPWCARAVVAAYACVFLYALSLSGPGFVKAYTLAIFAARHDAQVSRSGNSVSLQGLITGQIGQKAVAALEQPEVTTLYISSPGGMVWSAKHIETIVHRRGLTVVAGPDCFSACTLILAAAKRRVALVNAQFGFHRAQSFGAVSDLLTADFREDSEDLLRWAGADNAFIARALGPQTDTALYWPSLGELIAQGIITDVMENGRIVAGRAWCGTHTGTCPATK